MLTVFDIHKWANKKSFSRGMDLYDNDKILQQEYSASEMLDIHYIEAEVKGSGRNIYHVEIGYEYVSKGLTDVSCGCIAFASYDGLCKHCVAVLVEYIASGFETDINEEVEEEDDLSYENYKTNASRYIQQDITSRELAKPRVRKTPLDVKELLKGSYVQDLKPILSDSMEEMVKLEPILKCTYDSMTVTLSIGSSRMYKVKSVIELGRNITTKSYHSYGKQLSFKHSLSSFDDESRELAKFIGKYHKEFGDSYYYGYTTRKEIPLDKATIVPFLETIETNGIYVQHPSGQGLYSMTREKITRDLKIVGYEDGIGISAELLMGYSSDYHYIYFKENKIYINEQKEMEDIKEFLEILNNYHGKEVFIAKEDVKEFCDYLLPLLENHYKVTRDGFDESEYGSEEAHFEIYIDMPERDKVVGRIVGIYGDHKINIFADEKRAIRDELAEYKVNKGVSIYFNDYDPLEGQLILSDNEDLLYDLVTYGFEEMKSFGDVFVTDAFKKLKVISFTKLKVGVSLKSDLLELSVTGEELDHKQLGEVLDGYHRKKRYHRLKDGNFIDVQHKEIEVLYNLAEGLNIPGRNFEEGLISLPKYRAMYIDQQLKKNHSLPLDRDNRFKSLIRNMKTVEDNEYNVPSGLDKILREYQKIGFSWMTTLYDNGFGGILADDMGLGKSLQVITFLKYQLDLGDFRKALIVCPSSLVYNWENEFIKFAPDLSVVTVSGKPKERELKINGIEDKDILITSYDLLKRDLKLYKDIGFCFQIIDEAQYIKNHGTQVAKAVKSIRSGYKLALTGTPIENRLSELWSIFDYLMPGFLYSYKQFKEGMELPIVVNKDLEASKRLSSMITPFVLRRLKSDVLSDLPDKIEENVILPISGDQQKLYDAHVTRIKNSLNNQSDEDFNSSKIKVLAELTKLRQLCCDPGLIYEEYQDVSAKVEVCLELIEEAVDGGHKVLLFSQFTSMFPIIQKYLEKARISYYTLTGKTSKEKRIKLVNAFNHDSTSVFCISLKAGGTGLNLTGADIVIHFDPWWNIAVQNQASDRAHRIGQKNVVNVYKLIVKNSVEEKILELQEAKKELADQMLSGSKISVGSFSKEELMDILG